jgi:hypothetical protein
VHCGHLAQAEFQIHASSKYWTETTQQLTSDVEDLADVMEAFLDRSPVKLMASARLELDLDDLQHKCVL